MKKILHLLLFGLICLPSLVLGQTKNIDCNQTPSTPDQSWSIVSSQPDGAYQLGAEIKTVSFESRTNPIKGERIAEKLNGTGLNACVLDYLMKHQELIPESWKGKNVVFAGTVFKDGGDNKLFRTLIWWDNHWDLTVTYFSEAYDDRVAAIK